MAKPRVQIHRTDYGEGDWEGQPLREKQLYRKEEGPLEKLAMKERKK